MKLYKIALFVGTHQHRWAGDGSGECEKCHKEHTPHRYSAKTPGVCTVCGATGKCSHPEYNTYDNDGHICKVCYQTFTHMMGPEGSQEACKRCSVCGYGAAHKYENGVCTVCHHACTHPSWKKGENGCVCNACGTEVEHTFRVVEGTHHITQCQACIRCKASLPHTGITKLGDTCTNKGCAYVHNEHFFGFIGGAQTYTCPICGYKCPHDSINEYGACNVCKKQMLKAENDPYVNGPVKYAGGYEFLKRVYTNSDSTDYYSVYKGYRKGQDGSWVSNGYYMTRFDITNDITRFGGDYAYKIKGWVWSESESAPVNPALLESDAAYQLRLAQFSLDGTLLKKNDVEYDGAPLHREDVVTNL